jgi:glycosidase
VLRHEAVTGGHGRAVSDWVRHAVWWQVYPLGFVGAERQALPPDAPAVPRLRQLEAWLPYLVGLGANGLALGPVFASQTHGYDTVDHFTVDARLGTEDDLVRLVQACHERGVRVLLDGVFNHVARSFGEPSWAARRRDGSLRVFEGHDALVVLDHSRPEVADHVARVMTHWCDRGVDAWRLDAAYAVPPAFWASVLPRVRARHPDVWVVGEMIHGDYARYVAASGVDAVTQYELWKAVWSALNDRNLFELSHALERHAQLVPAFLPQTFVGNHDVTRITSRLDDPRHLPLALAVLLTLPGVPAVYYGDERALTGVKEDRAGGDDAVRPAYPADPSGLDGSGEQVLRLHQSLIGLRRRHPWLAAAQVHRPDVLSNQVLAYRLSGEGRWLGLVLNTGDVPAQVRLPIDGAGVLAGDASTGASSKGGTSVRVSPHGFAVVG